MKLPALILTIGAILLLSVTLFVPLGPYVWRVGSLFLLAVIVAAGLHLVTGMARVVSLCHVAFCGVAAYASGALAKELLLSPIVTIGLGALISGVVALLLAWCTRSLEDIYLTLATLAASEILGNLFRGWATVTGGSNGLIGVPPLSIFGIPFDTPERSFFLCAIGASATLVFILLLERAALGKALRAVGDAEILVETFGFRRDVLRLVAFSAGGLIAGLAGAIAAHMDGFVGPESFGVSQSVAFLCYLTLGCLGRFRSIIIAGAFAVIGTELLRAFQGSQMVVLSILVIVSLLWRARQKGKKELRNAEWSAGTRASPTSV